METFCKIANCHQVLPIVLRQNDIDITRSGGKKIIKHVTAAKTKHVKTCKNLLEKKGILCWHCAHPFKTNPVPAVSRHDSIHNSFTTYGYFCSWSCAKAYILENSTPRHSAMLHHFRLVTTGESDPIHPAPARYALEAFGGDLTIQQFRKRHACTHKCLGAVKLNTAQFLTVSDTI